jgi:ATP-dependent DNA helicase RecG
MLMAQLSMFSENTPEQGEIEYKTASKGRLPSDIWEAVTAFSNAEGGKVVFGVKPDGTIEPMGAQEIDLLQRNILSDLSAYSYKINPSITVYESTVSVYIPPAPAAVRPVYSLKRGLPKGAKVRVGSANVQVDEEWMRRFAIAAQGGAEQMTFNGNYREILDLDAVQDYITRLNTRRGGVYANYFFDEVIRKLSIVDANGKVTMFGLLAFSRDAYLQDIVSPTLTVVITQYSGSGKVTGPKNEAYLDNREFYGPVKKQYEEALTFLLSKIPIKGVLEEKSGMRIDQYIIPYNAVREALANTLAHRDYSVHSSRIQVDVYADRIEFINPGRSLVPIPDLETAPSMSRNPLLMNYLREIGATEQLARGIRTIKYELREAGLQEPMFANINSSFVATIYHSAFILQDDRDWLNRFSGYRLNERQRAGLAALKKSKEGMSNSEYRKANGMNKMGDDKLANKELKRMVDKGILHKSGENRATRYYIVDAFLREE